MQTKQVCTIMNPEEAKKEEIIALAKETERYCDLLIAQSDSWLPEVTDSMHTHPALGKCRENSESNLM